MATPRPTKKATSSTALQVEDEAKKTVDADDKAFIQKLVSDSHQDIYFQGWIDLYYQDKEPKKRILVVTNFRVFTIKVNVLGRSVRQQFPILDLSKMQVAKDNDRKITLEFANGATPTPPAGIVYEKSVLGIAQSILFSYQAITFGRHPESLPKIEIPPDFYSTFLPPEPDAQDGLLAAYLAECDYNKLEQRIPVLDYLMTCFQLEERTLDLGECLNFIDKENPKTDVQALASALRYSKWFTEITTVGFPLKNEGLTSMSQLLTVNSAISKLVLVNIKAAGKPGFSSLSTALAKGVHNLNFLNLSKNNIGDPGLKSLVEGLKESKKVLKTLCLRGCGFSGKGLKALMTMLSQGHWLAGLKILDVSDNPMSKAGTTSLCEWLAQPTNTIEQLYVVGSDIVPEQLFQTLESNKALCMNHLTTLNISGNKLNKKAVPILCAVLEKTASLRDLFLSNAGVTRSFLVQIVDHVFKNTTSGLGFSIDFSNNHLGVRGIKDLDTLYTDLMKKDSKRVTESGKLHTLVLSDNELGTEGIVLACKALKGSSLSALNLDRNVKVGMFNPGKEAGEALALLINDTPHLKELTVAGSDSMYLKTALLPLVSAIATNNTLRHLDISKNKLGDQGIHKLAEALTSNTSLTAFNAEGNKIGLKGLEALHAATTKNRTLLDWIIPMDDVSKLFKSSNDKKTKDLVLKIVHDLELNMERNQKALRSSDTKVGGMTAQELDILLSTKPSVIRMSNAVNDDNFIGGTQRHRKTASRLLDMMSQAEGDAPSRSAYSSTPISPTPTPPSTSSLTSPTTPKKTATSVTSPTTPTAIPPQSPSSDGPRPPPLPSTGLKTVGKPVQPVGPVSPIAPHKAPVTPSFKPPSSTPTTPSRPSENKNTPPLSPSPPTSNPPPQSLPAAGEGKFDDYKLKTYPFEKLESTVEVLPPGVNPALRELYLDNDRFHELFEGMSKEDYLRLQKWKRDTLKKKNGLF